MARKGNIKVIHENESGRNKRFKDNTTGRYMSRDDFNTAIKNGTYTGFHIRKINGIETPVSNPDKSKNNNLG